MANPKYPTPMLDQLETGPWPSFVTGIKRLRDEHPDERIRKYNDSLLGQLEHSYETKKGYWKGGTVGVFGYGGGIIPRFSEVADKFPESSEMHTLRVQPPPGLHYTSDLLRKMCDMWEKKGSGIIAFHGQSGDIMLQGCHQDDVQEIFDDFNEAGFDLGGAGPAVRTSFSCVGMARCEQAMYDTQKAHRVLVNDFLDDMHRPALPYKFKFKFSACPNDCMNAVHRSDMAVIGTWRNDMKVNQDAVKEYVASKGRQYVIDNVITRCPTNSLALKDDDTLAVDNRNCVRCMHCINVMTKALSPGDDQGVTILIGGKRTLKIGDLMGTVVVPFMKLESDDDWERIGEIAADTIDFFAENALEHERTGEMIERIGLINFLEGVGLDVDPNMVDHPRTSSYFRADDWDEEVDKWNQRKAAG